MIKNLSHDTVPLTCPDLNGELYSVQYTQGLDQTPQSETTEL
jgi:hypothetical protein